MVSFDRRWLPLNALRAFESVGQLLSFTLAANALQVSQAAVSRHVINLENLLGHKLLDRRAQSVSLTPAGAALLPVLQESFDRMEHVLNAITNGSDNTKSIRLHLPPAFAQKFLPAIVRKFRQDFPDYRLCCSTIGSQRRIASDVDIAIVYSKSDAPLESSKLLWRSYVTPLCSPFFANMCREVGMKRALCEAQLIDVKPDGEFQGISWSGFAKQFGIRINGENIIELDSPVLAAQYAQESKSIALLDPILYSDDLLAGKLAAPFRHSLDTGFGYFALTPDEDCANPIVTATRSWLITEFATPNITRLSA
jgi:DNA-binding transcriptional LysR family regulator